MSLKDQPESSTIGNTSLSQGTPSRAPAPADAPTLSLVEMNSLQADGTIGSSLEQQNTHQSLNSAQMPHLPIRTDTSTAILSAQNPPPPLPHSSSPLSKRERSESTAIGPSSDSPLPVSRDAEESGPTLMITLLLLSGARHPFNLDAKYLAKRNVQAQNNDPFNLSIYKVKELILREWRDEWESKPSSPGAIRLIHLGKVLDDKTATKDLRFNHTGTNVVHMSIKPQDFMDDEDAKGAKASRTQSHDGTEGRSPRCRCIIM